MGKTSQKYTQPEWKYRKKFLGVATFLTHTVVSCAVSLPALCIVFMGMMMMMMTMMMMACCSTTVPLWPRQVLSTYLHRSLLALAVLARLLLTSTRLRTVFVAGLCGCSETIFHSISEQWNNALIVPVFARRFPWRICKRNTSCVICSISAWSQLQQTSTDCVTATRFLFGVM